VFAQNQHTTNLHTTLSDTPGRETDSENGLGLGSSNLATNLQRTYPFATAPIIHNESASDTLTQPSVDRADPGTTTLTEDGLSLVSSVDQLPQYTAQHRDQFLDTAVEPDDDKMDIVDDYNEPDPIAAEKARRGTTPLWLPRVETST